MPHSLFARVTRYPRSHVIDPRENRLTEVTAAVLERVDGLAHGVLIEALSYAVAVAKDQERLAGKTQSGSAAVWGEEAVRLRGALAAAKELTEPRVSVRTQVTTVKGRFVDLDVWLRPHRPADDAADIRVWFEVKHGADIHGNQLDVYLHDIHGFPATHKVVLLLVPRGQELASVPPIEVARIDWQRVSVVVAGLLRPASGLPADQAWLLSEYADYLREEGLMTPDAVTAAHALTLDGVRRMPRTPSPVSASTPRPGSEPTGASRAAGANRAAASVSHDYGSQYWAAYKPHVPGGTRAKTWPGAWFDWGFGWTSDWHNLEDEVVRGSVAMWAGVGLETKGNPLKVEGNDAWLAGRLADGFHSCWFAGYNRLVRIKHPDELLAATTIEAQGDAGSWTPSRRLRLTSLRTESDAPPIPIPRRSPRGQPCASC